MIFQIAEYKNFPVSELSFSGYIVSFISQHLIKNPCLWLKIHYVTSVFLVIFLFDKFYTLMVLIYSDGDCVPWNCLTHFVNLL